MASQFTSAVQSLPLGYLLQKNVQHWAPTVCMGVLLASLLVGGGVMFTSQLHCTGRSSTTVDSYVSTQCMERGGELTFQYSC